MLLTMVARKIFRSGRSLHSPPSFHLAQLGAYQSLRCWRRAVVIPRTSRVREAASLGAAYLGCVGSHTRRGG